MNTLSIDTSRLDYTTAEAAERLRCCKKTVLAYVKQDKLNAYVVGRGVFFTKRDLQKFLAKRKVGGSKDNLHR